MKTTRCSLQNFFFIAAFESIYEMTKLTNFMKVQIKIFFALTGTFFVLTNTKFVKLVGSSVPAETLGMIIPRMKQNFFTAHF